MMIQTFFAAMLITIGGAVALVSGMCSFALWAASNGSQNGGNIFSVIGIIPFVGGLTITAIGMIIFPKNNSNRVQEPFFSWIKRNKAFFFAGALKTFGKIILATIPLFSILVFGLKIISSSRSDIDTIITIPAFAGLSMIVIGWLIQKHTPESCIDDTGFEQKPSKDPYLKPMGDDNEHR